jgi:2-haloacid dehalogenase
MRLVTLSNGSDQVAESLLTRSGLRSDFEAVLTVEDAPAWKPVQAAYDYAAAACGVKTANLLLVAVHPWDINGAARAGLRTAWLNRTGESYPSYFAAPDHTIAALSDLAPQLK